MAARLTTKGRTFAGRVSPADFARFMHAEFARSRQVLQGGGGESQATALAILEREEQRLKEMTLYFLEIEAASETLHKIGVTTRPVAERVQKIAASCGDTSERRG